MTATESIWAAFEDALHVESEELTVLAAARVRTPAGTASAAFVLRAGDGDRGEVCACVCSDEAVGRYLAERFAAETAFADAAWVDGRVSVGIKAKKKSVSRTKARVRAGALDLRIRAEGFGPMSLIEDVDDGGFGRRGVGHTCATTMVWDEGDEPKAVVAQTVSSPMGLWTRL